MLNNQIEAAVSDYIARLDAQIAACEQEVKQLKFKKTCMEEFFQDQAEKQKEDIKARRTEISPGMAKFMDDKDVTKINLFLQFLDKCGDDPARANIQKVFPKLNHYIYNKKRRLWNSIPEFKADFDDWVARKGYWTNALPHREGHEDDLNYPMMVVG